MSQLGVDWMKQKPQWNYFPDKLHASPSKTGTALDRKTTVVETDPWGGQPAFRDLRKIKLLGNITFRYIVSMNRDQLMWLTC